MVQMSCKSYVIHFANIFVSCGHRYAFKCIFFKSRVNKSCIRETLNLLACANSSTDSTQLKTVESSDKLPKPTQTDPNGPKSAQKYQKVLECTQNYSEVPKNTQKDLKITQDYPKYPKVGIVVAHLICAYSPNKQNQCICSLPTTRIFK